MLYTKLGAVGVDLSRLCLDCITIGDQTRGNHDRMLDGAAEWPILRQASDAIAPVGFGLSKAGVARVETPSTPYAVVGFS